MNTEENRALSRRGIEEAWNKGNLSIIDEVIVPDIVIHDLGNPAGEIRGREAVKAQRVLFRTAFPDLHLTIEDTIAERDKVMVRFTARGTHRGELLGMVPTGKQVVVSGIAIDRYADGKVVEGWGYFDRLGLLQQLGMILQGLEQ